MTQYSGRSTKCDKWLRDGQEDGGCFDGQVMASPENKKKITDGGDPLIVINPTGGPKNVSPHLIINSEGSSKLTMNPMFD